MRVIQQELKQSEPDIDMRIHVSCGTRGIQTWTKWNDGEQYTIGMEIPSNRNRILSEKVRWHSRNA